ncbi:10385_t:CDS:2 [Funneliformis caledonium]|uniref:10385_t:CDS:1 n=1 Tax=Funneliformis caledonium TaxID=1117310 RepID=A0A9N9GC05_9GLOM|nr:10385_t:CDS:2 [Funneliformis caledonium]
MKLETLLNLQERVLNIQLPNTNFKIDDGTTVRPMLVTRSSTISCNNTPCIDPEEEIDRLKDQVEQWKSQLKKLLRETFERQALSQQSNQLSRAQIYDND